MRIERLALSCALLLGACWLLSACPGTLDDAQKQRFEEYAATHAGSTGTAGSAPAGDAGAPPAVEDPCGDVPARIFAPTCGGTGCHSAAAPQQDLDLVSPDVAARVVGMPGKTCLQTLADPENPEGSLMYLKLLPLPGCGAQMPLARPPLNATDVACVRAWIAAQ